MKRVGGRSLTPLTPRRRVLVTDGETRAAVAAVRGLEQAGFDVIAVAADGPPVVPAHWSRAVAQRLRAPSPLADPDGFIAALDEHLIRAGVDVLIPGSDAALGAISADRARLPPHVLTGLPDREAVARALDKASLAEAAAAHRLAPPATLSCESTDEVHAAADRLGLPLYAKPLASVQSDNGRRRHPARLVQTSAELEAARREFGGRILLQQRAHGEVISYAGVSGDGTVLAEAVSRYHRSWPPQDGDACLSETIAAPAELRRRVAAVIGELGWQGIFELELIHSPSGDWHAIDLNPRIYGSMALALGAGVNLPGLWCRHLLGEPVVSAVAVPGLRYRWSEGDIRHGIRSAWPKGQPLSFEVGRDGQNICEQDGNVDRRGNVVHPYARLTDLGPAVARALEIGDRMLKQRAGRSTTATQSKPVVVIGAGPNGLAATAHLRAAGVPTLCFGEPVDSWAEQMPAGMLLRSQWRSSHISSPGHALSLDAYASRGASSIEVPGERLSREQFIDYGRWFARQAVPDADARRISSVAPENGHWRVTLEDDEVIAASRVVVAAGISLFASRPSPFTSLPQERCSHAYDHDDLSGFSGRRVAVIGSGQSALECAALLHEHGAQVTVVCRTKAIHWLAPADPPADVPTSNGRSVPQPPSDIGGPFTGWAGEPDLYRRLPERMKPTVFFRCVRPAGAAWLRPRLTDVDFHFATTATSARLAGDQVQLGLDDASTLEIDHVLLGTGYEIDVRRYPFLDAGVGAQLKLANGYPALGDGFESSLPGLHFIGAPAGHSFGPLMRFVVGTWYTAPALARRIAGRRQPPVTFSFRQEGVPLREATVR